MMRKTSEEVICAVRAYVPDVEGYEMRDVLAALAYLEIWGLISLEQWAEVRKEYVTAINENEDE